MSHQGNWAQFLAHQGKWAELLLYYQGGIAGHNFLLQSYRMLFLMVEAMIFAGALGLIQIYEGDGLPWYFWPVFFIGLCGIILWIWLCEDRESRMTAFGGKFKREIEKGIPGYKVKERTFTYRLARYSFNFGVPLLLLAAWVSVVLSRLL